MSIFKSAIACTLSGALVASQMSPVAAGPMPTNVATMKSMVSDRPTQVHWHGGWGWGIGGGLLAGALIGGAIASSTYGYYGAPYYYGYSYLTTVTTIRAPSITVTDPITVITGPTASTAITIITGRIIIVGGTTTIEHLCLTAGSATLEGMMEEDAEQLGQLRHGRLKNETAARDERRGVTSTIGRFRCGGRESNRLVYPPLR